jgi:hypothetical protein
VEVADLPPLVRSEVRAVKTVVALWILASLFFVGSAFAQNDIELYPHPDTGLYGVWFLLPPEPDVETICAHRLDASPLVVVGCWDYADEGWPTPDGRASVTFAVAPVPGTGTPLGDAEVRFNATDFAGNASAYSNPAYVHFGALPPDTTPPSAPIVVATPPPVVTEIRVNVNGEQHEGIDHAGTWIADPGIGGVCGPSAYTNHSQMIAGTEDDVLFHGEVYGNPVVCQIPVPIGDYTVSLHFAEIYLGPGCPSGADGTGLRVFHVELEGSLTSSNVDLFAEAGCGVPVTRTSDVTVTDGTLDVRLLSVPPSSYSPKISAIEVVER